MYTQAINQMAFQTQVGPTTHKKNPLFLYPLDHFKCASCRRCFCIDLRAHVNLSLSLISLLFSFFWSKRIGAMQTSSNHN